MVSKRYSSGLQKAFVIGEGSLDVSDQCSVVYLDNPADISHLGRMI